MMNNRIKMFASCILVKGNSQASICDLQRSVIQLIPNDLCDLINDLEVNHLSAIKKKYDYKYDEVIDEYVNFLVENEFAFYTNTPELFPDLNLFWDAPFKISNCIIDISLKSKYNVVDVIDQLEEINCKHIQIRLYDGDYAVIIEILKHVEKIESIINSIDIILPYHKSHLNKFDHYPRINSVIFTNCTIEQKKEIEKLNREKIKGTLNPFQSVKYCGVISKINFAVNIPVFTESQTYNTCLNRKIAIDINGNIKNCPSMPVTYGNIVDTTLREALNKPGFKKYWDVNKDQISICKDCEFRHVCTDCRAYTERTHIDKEGLDLSKPLKCGYDPYTNKWEEWSTNPLKEKAIEFYAMQELVKKE